MTAPAYVNVHGQPLEVSARDAVLSVHPEAMAHLDRFIGSWIVRRSKHHSAGVIATGSNEEAAWREAWSRLLVESMKSEEAKP